MRVSKRALSKKRQPLTADVSGGSLVNSLFGSFPSENQQMLPKPQFSKPIFGHSVQKNPRAHK